MKWIALSPIIVLLTACGYFARTGSLEFRSVTWAPAVTTTVVTSPVVLSSPVYYDPVTVIDEDPVDVTTTTLDYY